MRQLSALVLGLAGLAGLAACTAPGPGPDRAAVCADLFARYDTAARVYGNTSANFGEQTIVPAPLSRWVVPLRAKGCLTSSADLDAVEVLAQTLPPYTIATGGPAIRPPVPVHLGIVTGIADEARVTRFFRGLGYRSRGVGAEGLGRRLYIGPFANQAALDQALALAREAGFIAPYAAKYTRF